MKRETSWVTSDMAWCDKCAYEWDCFSDRKKASRLLQSHANKCGGHIQREQARHFHYDPKK